VWAHDDLKELLGGIATVVVSVIACVVDKKIQLNPFSASTRKPEPSFLLKHHTMGSLPTRLAYTDTIRLQIVLESLTKS
jgi:hypothetical protein